MKYLKTIVGLSFLGARGLSVVFAVVMAVTVAAYFAPKDRSVVISARARSVQIAFSGGQLSKWSVERFVLCRRKEVIDRKAIGVLGDICDRRVYTITSAEGDALYWPEGSVVSVSKSKSKSGLVIKLLSVGREVPQVGGSPLSPGALLFVSGDAWDDGHVLPFAGRVQIGDIPSAGSNGILETGSYEIREAMWFQTRAPAVTTGVLLRGDSARVLGDNGEENRSIGFLSLSDGEGVGFDVTAYSPLGDAKIEVMRLGSDPIIVSPTWIDRALNDVYITAFAALIGAIAAIGSTADALRRLFRRLPGSENIFKLMLRPGDVD